MYQYEASNDYDPAPELEKIHARLIAVEFADDVVRVHPDPFDAHALTSRLLRRREVPPVEKGLTVEARVQLDDGTLLTAFNDPNDLHGVRVEFIDDRDRTRMEEFMRTGGFDEPYDKFSFPNPGEMRL